MMNATAATPARWMAAALFALTTVGLLAPSQAKAGGYDTPMLYSARHMGMGGTAVSYVDDPSALFHNPAGLSGTDRLTLMGDFSLLVGTITGNPAEDNQNLTSNTTVGPFFLVGGSGRITDWLTVGLAVYPVASAGATYEYDGGIDQTTLFFLEISPGVAVEIPDTGLSFGAGYRVTYASLDRSRDQGTAAAFDLSGLSYAGFRVGAQYKFLDHFSVGLAYRHKTTTDVEGQGFLFDESAETAWVGSFTLPSRLSMGGRMDYGAFGVAVDAEYGLQSQNPRGQLEEAGGRGVIDVTQISDWTNAWTVRLGAEYRLLEGKLPIRLGFIWDQQTSNRAYPTAFGTPPAPTYVATAGLGYNAGPWQLNVAYAFRTGSTTITPEDIDGRDGCLSCGEAGEYSIKLSGIYVDFSYHFGRGETREGEGGVEYRSSAFVEPEPEVEPEPDITPEPEPEVAQPEAAPAFGDTGTGPVEGGAGSEPVEGGMGSEPVEDAAGSEPVEGQPGDAGF